MGNVYKCFAVYKSPFWREKGYNGYVLSTEGFFGEVYDAHANEKS